MLISEEEVSPHGAPLLKEGSGALEIPTLIGASTGWYVGLVVGVIVAIVAAVLVAAAVGLASKIALQTRAAVDGVEKVREQTDALAGVGRINDSGVRILHAARALRKVAVGK